MLFENLGLMYVGMNPETKSVKQYRFSDDMM